MTIKRSKHNSHTRDTARLEFLFSRQTFYIAPENKRTGAELLNRKTIDKLMRGNEIKRLKKVMKLSLAILACCSPFLYAQPVTNVPSGPMPTAGHETAYSVVCKFCTREQVLIPRSVKVITTTSNHMGQLQKIETQFKCLGPKCNKTFYWPTDRWLRAPMQLAPASPMQLTRTNYVMPLPPKPKLSAPKGTP